MRNYQKIKNKTFFMLKSDKVDSVRTSFPAKIFSIPFLILLFVLTFTMSCKENSYGSGKNSESEYNSVTDAESAAKAQGGARASKEKVMEYVQKLHLIDDPMNYKIELTNDDLYIDGRKQPDEIHRHIIKNFVQNPDGHLEVTYTISTD